MRNPRICFDAEGHWCWDAGSVPQSHGRGAVYPLPLHPSGHGDMPWLPQWLVTARLMSRPRAAGCTPPKKTECKELKALGPPLLFPRWESGSLFPGGRGDGHFSGIDPWVFVCPALCREQVASTRRVQDKCGRPPADTARGQEPSPRVCRSAVHGRGPPRPGSVRPRRQQLGTRFISFTDHRSPRDTRDWTPRLCPDARGRSHS